MVDTSPFLLDLRPSPAGDRIACSYAWYNKQSGISVVVEQISNGAKQEIDSFELLHAAAMAWNPSGEVLAYAHLNRYQLWFGANSLVRMAPGPIRALAFDPSGNLWGVSGAALWCASPDEEFHPQHRLDDVLAICASPVVAAIVLRAGKLRVVLLRDDGLADFPWPLSVERRPSVQAAEDGTLFVAAEGRSEQGRIDFQIGRVQSQMGESRRFFSTRSGSGLGWPSVSWQPWTDDRVLATLEVADCFRTYLIEKDGSSISPVTPPNFDVTSMAAATASASIAVTGMSLTGSKPATESRLLVCRESNGEWQHHEVCQAVSKQTAWDHSGRNLFYARAKSTLESMVCVYRQIDDRVIPKISSEDAANRGWRTSERRGWPHVEHPGTNAKAPAVICVQGPHRRFVNGPQSTFFHHAIFSLLGELANLGFSVICLNGPGSSGRGRTVRECPTSWLQATNEHLAECIQDLKAAGVRSIGVVAGSLGALPVLHVLAEHSLAAAVLISPVCQPRIPALADWSHLFPDSSLRSLEELALRIDTPTLILQGLRDEMTASGYTSRFVAQLRAGVCCEYTTIPDEGHIFCQRKSWESVATNGSCFLQKHMPMDNLDE